jgi:RimK family alpha-L-glutamate ligase
MGDDYMTGWLIVNEFLHSNKFNDIHEWFLEAARKQGVVMKIKTNAQLLIDLTNISYKAGKHTENINKKEDGNADFVLFWDKDIRLAYYLELLGYRVFNCARAIKICDDKSLTHLTLMNENIRMPGTIIAPKTFDNIGYTNVSFLDEISSRLGFPMVVKECFGSFGQQVYLVNNPEELKERIKQIGSKPLLFQEYIASSFGKDLRLQVVGSDVIASMLRYSDTGDFRANLSIGGKMKNYIATKEQCELALRCCEIIGLDFAGVDILFGKNEQPILCEVNSNAHFKNIYDCTGVNAADAIITYIKKKL